jgi:hypothetical protein
MLGGPASPASVQRAYASGIAGEIPPDQSLPEVWVLDDTQHAQAPGACSTPGSTPRTALGLCRLRRIVDGPFEQCWNCGADARRPRA